MRITKKYRLGLDLGTNSLGWCLIALDEDDHPTRFLRMGVRIFPDGRNPKDGTSLAAARRLARSMRRRRDRFLKRRTRLMRLMIEHGFMPADKQEREQLRALDPYELRRRGLDVPLTPFEFGRALFHLNQRRGFQSNRKVDRSGDDDRGKIATAIGKVQQQMDADGARTIGEWLGRRHERREPVRARLNGQGARSQYEFYVQRSMIAAEFDALWAAQSRFNPIKFTPHARDILRDALLFQRPLRPVRPGKCPFEPAEDRAALALPSVQRFRIFQEVNHLRILETGKPEYSLTKPQRDCVADALLRHSKRSFDQLRKLLDLPEDATFNLESAKRKDLRGDTVGAELARKTAFGPQWLALPLEQQDEIVQCLLDAEQEETITATLRERYGLSAEQAAQVARVRLVEGYGGISRKAILKILPYLESDVVTYDAAARSAGYDHARRNTGGELVHLPYYAEWLPQYVGTSSGEVRDPPEKRFGRIANPTVHVALNQLRAVVNAIIDKYGRPHQIVIELARDLKLSRERKRQIEQEQQRRQEDNDRYRHQLEEHGLPVNGGNLLRVRLWEELASSPTDRRCPYTGEMISFSRLFREEVEIEHILPFSATLDDSASNKTVAMRKANRDKGNRSPFEAFGHSPPGYDWEQILNRASLMPFPKRRRFAPDALAQYQADGDFLARHLTDTAFVSRVAREYLTAVCPSNQVWSIPGRLTALLRKRWGLNTLLSETDGKNRTDQRHHTIDAAVVAVTDRALLQRLSTLSARGSEEGVHRFLEGLEEPWPGYRRGLEFGLGKVVVSYKPDHGTGARLHNDTAYGLITSSELSEGPVEVVHRVPLSSIKGEDEAERIRDPLVRRRAQEVIRGKTGKDVAAALEALSLQTGIRRVRVVESLSVIPIRRADGTPYKAYKGDSNYCYQVFASANTGRWYERVVSSFEAVSEELPVLEDSMVMQLCVNDTLRLHDAGTIDGIFRVVSLTPGKILLASHQEGGNLRERDRDRTDGFKYLICSASRLQKLQAQQVVVDPIGQVWPVKRKRSNEGADRRDRGERPVLVVP
jgi:CRISPR-associated endonuclease Csn1